MNWASDLVQKLKVRAAKELKCILIVYGTAIVIAILVMVIQTYTGYPILTFK